jgi:hypothetical protein
MKSLLTNSWRLDIRVATVKEVSLIEGADRLLRLVLDVGDQLQAAQVNELWHRVFVSGTHQKT